MPEDKSTIGLEMPEYKSPFDSDLVNQFRSATNFRSPDEPVIDSGLSSLNLDSGTDTFEPIDINIKDQYSIIGGKLHSKYKDYGYAPGRDNAEYWAQRQSRMDKIANGFGRFALKGSAYASDSVIGFVAGVGNAIYEGNLHAFSDNSFSKMIEETNQLIDNELPVRMTKEEENMSLIRQATRASFWWGDVMDAGAFMIGAVGSELAMGYLTGGSSWALSGAKWGAKLAAKSVSGAAKLAKLRKASALVDATYDVARNKFVKGIGKRYIRSVKAGHTLGGLANNIRYVATSTGFEAGVEARASLDENLAAFRSHINETEGRDPTYEEYEKFIPEAIDASNGVFLTNVGILGLSNIAQFGKLAGLSRITPKFIPKAASGFRKKVFGKGFTIMDDGTAQLYQSNRLQRTIGKTYDWFKNPVVEAMEEGSQGVAQSYFGNSLETQYDPESVYNNMTALQVAKESIKHQVTTKEGQKEMFIGAIVGKLGGIFNGGVKGLASDIAYGTEYKADIESLEKDIKAYNKGQKDGKFKVGLDKATRESIQRFALFNQQMAAQRKGISAAEKGDKFSATTHFSAAAFHKMQADSRLGMEEEGFEDFKKQVENMSDQEFSDTFGVDTEVIKEAKEGLIESYKQDLKDFSRSKNLAEKLAGASSIKGLKKQHYEQEVAFSLYMGFKGMESISDIGKSIEEALGENGFASHLAYYNSLTKKQKNIGQKYRRKDKRLKELDEEYAILQQEYSTLLDQSKRVENNKSVVSKIESNRKKAEKILAEKEQVAKERAEIKREIENSPKRREYNFGTIYNEDGKIESDQTLIDSLDSLDKLDSYLESLRKENPDKAAALESMLFEYRENIKALEGFDNTINTLTDARFNPDKYKGVAKALKRAIVGRKDRKKANDTNYEYTKVERALKDLMDKTPDLDEYEQFHILSIAQLLNDVENFDTLPEDVRNTISRQEEITNEEFKDFIENGNVDQDILERIAELVLDNETLTQREKRIKEKNEDEISNLVKKLKRKRGDALRKAKREEEKVTPKEDSDQTRTIRQLIQDILDRKQSYMRGKSRTDDFNKESIPTEDEYRRYDKLRRDAEKRPLSKKRQSEFETLQEKINNWGNVEGTVSGQFSLLELYTQLFELESLNKEELNQVSEGEHAAEPQTDEIEASGKTYYDILQTYDKVFYSVRKGITSISNISAKRLVEHIQKITGGNVDVKINGKKAEIDKLSTLDSNRNHKITLELEGGESITFTLSANRGRLDFNEENRAKLETIGNLSFGTSYKGKPMTAYQTVMQIVDGQSYPLNAQFDNDLGKANVAEIQEIPEGAEVRAVVDMEDPYNKNLLTEYRKRKGKKNEMSYEEFRNKLKVEYRYGDVFVGYVKQNHPSQNETGKQKAAIAVRDAAANKALNNLNAKELEVGVRHSIKKLWVGHPQLRIIDGEVQMTEIKESQKDAIDDIGYVEDGKVVTRKGEEGVITSFIDRIIKDKNSKFSGKKVPIVVLNFKGKKIAFPVEMSEVTNENAPQEFDEILKKDTPVLQKVIEIYNLLSENGIDPKKSGLRADNFSEPILQGIRQQIVDNKQHADIQELTNSKESAKDVAVSNMLISIDLDGNMFHSPKVVLDYGVEEDSGRPSEEITEEDLEGETAAVEIGSTESVTPPTQSTQAKKDEIEKNKELAFVNSLPVDTNISISELNKLGIINPSLFGQSLFNAITSLASKLNVQVRFTNGIAELDSRVGGNFDTNTGIVTINLNALYESYQNQLQGKGRASGTLLGTKSLESFEQFIQNAITHELIHSVTQNAYDNVVIDIAKKKIGRSINSLAEFKAQLGGLANRIDAESIYNEVLNNGYSNTTNLNQIQIDALSSIGKIFNYLNTLDSDTYFGGKEYGLVNMSELMAELSNEGFVAALQRIELPENLRYSSKNKNIFESIISFVSDLFKGKKVANNAADSLFASLSDIITSPQSYTFTEGTFTNNSANTVQDKINAKYNAELKASEESTKAQPDIDSKKAEIKKLEKEIKQLKNKKKESNQNKTTLLEKLQSLPLMNENAYNEALEIINSIDFNNEQSISEGIVALANYISGKNVSHMAENYVRNKEKLIGNDNYKSKEYLESYINIIYRDFDGQQDFFKDKKTDSKELNNIDNSEIDNQIAQKQAELKASEESTQTQSTKAKKAEIERRRQEALNKIKTLTSETGEVFAPKGTINEKLLELGKFFQDVLGWKFEGNRKYPLYASKENNRAEFDIDGLEVNMPEGASFRQMGGQHYPAFTPVELINAKYDAELKALEESTTTPTQSEETVRNKKSTDLIDEIKKKQGVDESLYPINNVEENENFIKNKKRYQESNDKVYGLGFKKKLPNGEIITGRYVLVNKNDVKASHDPKSFRKTVGVPVNESGKTFNDNDYETNKQAQLTQQNIASNYDRQAIDDPVLIDRNGIVKSGNGRTISRQIATPETSQEYLTDLKEESGRFGFSQEQIDAIGDENVMIAVELDGVPEYSTEEYAKYNAQTTKAKTPLQKAKEISKRIDEETSSKLISILSEVENISSLNNGQKNKIKKTLMDAGLINKFDQSIYFDENNNLTEGGKEFLENTLLANIFNENELSILNNFKAVRNRLARNKVELTKNKGKEDALNIIENIKRALYFLSEAAPKQGTFLEDIDAFIRQGSLLETKKINANDVIWSVILQNQNDIRDILLSLNNAVSTENLFGEIATSEELLNQKINELINDETFPENKRSIIELAKKYQEFYNNQNNEQSNVSNDNKTVSNKSAEDRGVDSKLPLPLQNITVPKNISKKAEDKRDEKCN